MWIRRRGSSRSHAQLPGIWAEHEPYGGTNLAEALRVVLDGHFATAGARQKKKTIAVVITDGVPDNKKAVADTIVDATYRMEVRVESGFMTTVWSFAHAHVWFRRMTASSAFRSFRSARCRRLVQRTLPRAPDACNRAGRSGFYVPEVARRWTPAPGTEQPALRREAAAHALGGGRRRWVAALHALSRSDGTFNAADRPAIFDIVDTTPSEDVEEKGGLDKVLDSAITD